MKQVYPFFLSFFSYAPPPPLHPFHRQSFDPKSLPLTQPGGRVALQIYSKHVPGLTSFTLLRSLLKLYDGKTGSTTRDVLVYGVGVHVMRNGRIKIVANWGEGIPGLIIGGKAGDIIVQGGVEKIYEGKDEGEGKGKDPDGAAEGVRRALEEEGVGVIKGENDIPTIAELKKLMESNEGWDLFLNTDKENGETQHPPKWEEISPPTDNSNSQRSLGSYDDEIETFNKEAEKIGWVSSSDKSSSVHEITPTVYPLEQVPYATQGIVSPLERAYLRNARECDFEISLEVKPEKVDRKVREEG